MQDKSDYFLVYCKVMCYTLVIVSYLRRSLWDAVGYRTISPDSFLILREFILADTLPVNLSCGGKEKGRSHVVGGSTDYGLESEYFMILLT